jgi:replication factor C subunit 1
VPLLIEENYIDSSKSGIFKNPSLDDAAKLDRLAEAAMSISDMELAGASIMGQDQHWELLPVQAAMSVRAGSIVHGFQAFPSFPSWLGKNSTKTKKRRLTQEIVLHTSLSIGQGFSPIRLEYIPYLREILLQILLTSESGIETVIELFDSLGISKDDFSESLKDLQFTLDDFKSSKGVPNALTNRYELMDTKLKSALTRAYNSIEHKSQALVSLHNVKKKRGSLEGGDDEDGEGGGTTEDLDAAKVEEHRYVNDVGMVSNNHVLILRRKRRKIMMLAMWQHL